MAGSGRAAEAGVLFKGGQFIEAMQTVDTVVLDKTGTITEGKPAMTDISAIGFAENDLLQLVGSVEHASEHPLAQAVVRAAIERELAIIAVEQFHAIPGFGVSGYVNGKHIVVGTRNHLQASEIAFESMESEAEKMENAGKTVMFIGVDGSCAGVLAVADRIKPTSKAAIEKLKSRHLEIHMVTGDHTRVAQAIAIELGIQHVKAESLPTDKVTWIKALQRQGKRVAMVGDGINDAPALVTADIGVAIGTGTDVAIEAADVTLVRGDLLKLDDAVAMSRLTMRNIKQNLFWALVYNSIGIPIAAAGLLAPWLAGAAMALSSVSVVLNALRLQRMNV
jgi:Cu+-exporting ATPase